MSNNDSEMPGQVSIPLERGSRPEEADDISQDFGSSTQHLSRPSTQDSNTPPPKTLRTSELPKKVCEPSILLVLGHLALFHLPSVATTLTLVALYSVHFRWGDVSEEQLSYLQFAAKGHETLIIVSLADILMHRMRYALLQEKNGVPLGFLSSSFIIGSPISYFFSWELWAPVLRPGSRAKRARVYIQLTGLLIMISIILSVAVAPLSAIVIIPRTGWWHIRMPKGAERHIPFIDGPLWETDLVPRHGYQPHSGDSMVSGLSGIGGVLFDGLDNKTRQITNISFLSSYQRTMSIILDDVHGPENKEQSLAVATTPMIALQESHDGWSNKPKDVLTRTRQKVLSDRFEPGWASRENSNLTGAEKRKEFRQTPTSRWKQPVVAVECSVNETTRGTATFMFNSNITDNKVVLSTEENNGFKAFLKSARESDKNILDEEKPQRNRTLDPSPVYYVFLDLPGNHTSAAILFLHWIERDRASLSLCRVYSRWAEADTWLEPGESVFRSHLEAPLIDVESHFGSLTVDDDLIKMNKDWLNISSGSLNDTPLDSAYQYISLFCNAKIYKPCLPLSMATYMAYVLAYTYPARNYREKLPTTGDVVILREFFVGGYGYDWKSSNTIPFAFSVLLLHVLIVFIHTTIVLWSRHPWHSSSWGSFGQMMILALRSRALDGLGSVGAGVSSSQTWSTSVSVRVVDGEDQLEMVLQNEKGGHSQYQKVGGEAEEEGLDRGPSLVQPGVKYH